MAAHRVDLVWLYQSCPDVQRLVSCKTLLLPGSSAFSVVVLKKPRCLTASELLQGLTACSVEPMIPTDIWIATARLDRNSMPNICNFILAFLEMCRVPSM